MTNLSNPTPQKPTNNQNLLNFKQIQTETYELHKIQQNIQELAQNVTNFLNKNIISQVSTPVIPNYSLILTTFPAVLIFPKVIQDNLSLYNTQTGIFTVPQTGTFQLNFQGVFNGAGFTYLYITIFSSIQGIITQERATLAGGSCYLNFNLIFYLQNNEQVMYQISTDVGATVTLPYLAFASMIGVS